MLVAPVGSLTTWSRWQTPTVSSSGRASWFLELSELTEHLANPIPQPSGAQATLPPSALAMIW